MNWRFNRKKLTLLSESEHSNIKSLMTTALILKVIDFPGIRDKGLSHPHLQHIERYELLCYRDKIYIPLSLKKEHYPGMMNTFFIQARIRLRRQ
jgi:hypothetical protein